MKKYLGRAVLLVCLFQISASGQGIYLGKGPGQKLALPSMGKLEADFSRMPVQFIANQGQLDEEVDFYIQGKDKMLYFATDGVTIALKGKSERWVVKLDFADANPDVKPVGADKAEGVVSYFMGKPEDWRTGIPTYAKLIYPNLWPGIDLVYCGTVNRLKYEFIVHPGADPSLIRLAYRGAEKVEILEDGRLEVVTPLGTFQDDVPGAYQEVNGKRTDVALAYKMEDLAVGTVPDGRESPSFERTTARYGFEIGPFDSALPLILDPSILVYCGYIGGEGTDWARDIAVDESGFAYITGGSNSPSGFPVTVGPDLVDNGMMDVFVAKIKPTGMGFVYCGYIGGSENEGSQGIAVDSNGSAYIVGNTLSSEATFPVLGGPDLTFNGGTDIFVAKVNSTGTGLSYCGYIGGSSEEYGAGIAVDGSGNAYVTGYTWYLGAATFPVSVGPDLDHNGGNDAFVAKVNASGTGLSYCGYIGGYSSDYGLGVAVDAGGNAYVAGYTYSDASTFPVLGGLDNTQNGGSDAFVAKVNSSGTALVYCGYIGGASNDFANDIAVDGSGNSYLIGETYSSETDFPVLVGPDLSYNGGCDVYVAKVNATGGGLSYCGYIGGASDDEAEGIAVDQAGSVYLTGLTYSDETTFPVTGGPDVTYNEGSSDAFIAKLNPAGTRLVWCGYLGGEMTDHARGVSVDPSGNVYLAGVTYSDESTFPVLIGPGLIKSISDDAWVAKISPYVLQFPILDGKDYDGSGTSDISVYRPSDGVWYVSGQSDTQWGAPGDVPVPGNYDVDPATEIAVFRPSGGLWYIAGILTVQWGTSGDVPVPHDYSGDGVTDIAVWRPSNGLWYITGIGVFQYGQDGDYPVPGDYDGNGAAEVAVWRASEGAWYLYSGAYYQWGTAGDIPVPADYNGDGRTDLAVFRPSTGMWYIKYMGGGTTAAKWGMFGDLPVPGDYDGNGTTDLAVWRPSDGLWYFYGGGGSTTQYGQAGDVPLVR